MEPRTLNEPTAKASRSVIHPLSQEDSAAVAAIRSVVVPMKGKFEGTAGRGPFNGSYLGKINPKNPLASPLYGDLSGLPPIRIHVGDDEVLLDDSRRYVERAVAAGVDARLDVWMGMPHGFVTGVDRYNAAKKALNAVGEFLAVRLGSTAA
jgi:acetyl esterase/lipase